MDKTDTQETLANIDRWAKASRTAGFILVVIALSFALWPLTFCEECHYNEYGDWVGGVSGSIASVAAMAFLYVTYLAQRKQILIQQQEIADQKKEAERVKRNDETNSLENRFFKLLELHNEVLRSTDLNTPSPKIVSGRDSF